jgi:PAS domain S-box-containing protein
LTVGRFDCLEPDVTLFVDLPASLNRQRASQVVGFAVLAIAVGVLIGWRAGLPLLTRWGSGYSAGPFAVPMLAAFGLALVHPGKDSRFAFAVGLAGIAYAAVGLVVVLFHIELGIERWLAPRAPLAASFRVTSTGMLAFGLAAGALALSPFERHRIAATVLANIVSGIMAFALLGYLSGVDTLYGSTSVNSPSLPAAVGLLCVTIGIILRIGTMPVLRKSWPLRHLLVMLGSAIVAPLLLFGAYAGFRIADAQFAQVRNDLLSEARSLSSNIDREVTGEIERLQALATSPSLRQGDFAEFQRQAEASLRLRQSGNIVLIDRNMQELVNTWVPFDTRLGKAAVPESLVERSLATGKPQIAGLFIGSVTRRLMFSIIVPVQIDGKNRYALARSPDLDPLAGLVAAIELPPGRRAAVSDAAHRVIARSKQGEAFIGKQLPPARWHREVAGGTFEFIDSEGRPSLEASATSQLTGWHTAIWAPKALLEASVRVQWRTLGAMALLAVALVVASALWLGGIIAHAVSHAARAATDWGEEAPSRASGTPVAEVNTLMAELRETNQLLRNSERQLRLVTNNAPVGIVHLDAELRYKFLNRCHAERLKARLGLTSEQVIGKRLPEVVGDKLFAIIEPYARECLAGKAVEFQVEIPYQAGQPQFSQYRFEPEWKDGKVVGLVWAGTNITGLKHIEIALRESEATFRAMFDESSVGKIEVIPEQGRFLRANAAFCDFVGYSEKELRDLTVWDITHPEERERDREPVRRLISGESPRFDVEKRYIRKDGTPVWAHTTVNLIRDKSGYPVRDFAVIQDINERKRAEGDLKASKDRLQLALNAAQLGWWQYDPGHRVVSWDTRSKEILDIDEGTTALEELMKLVYPDDAEKVWATFQTARDPTDPKPYAIEFRVPRGDGKTRWVEVHWLAYFEGGQHERRAMSVVGTIQDITERKEREEKEHLLMREVNHRAKNMLSVVDAIAHQTAARSPEHFIERFSERIQALSANQDLLVRSEWHGVEIADLIRAQLAPFADLIGTRIVFDGPKLCLKPVAAQAIGLALHELATNAGKYGALSTDKGRVDVCWDLASGETLTMSWTEREGPLVSAPMQRGFGTIVMEAMTERSLNGTVDLNYAPAGLTWHLTCPAASALEPQERQSNVTGMGESGESADARRAKSEVGTILP